MTHSRRQNLSVSYSHIPNGAYNAHDMQHTLAMWDDPHVASTYRLWTQHISFFMAQPLQFFGVFVTNQVFRRSVFDAGLTFHPNTDPNHPVLINLNSARFGMAEKISALSPPAGIDLRRTSSAPPSTVPSTASCPTPRVTPVPSVTNTVQPPSSPLAIPPIHPVSSPVYLSPPGYYSCSSPLQNPESANVIYDPYSGVLLAPEGMDSLTISDHIIRSDEMIARMSDLKPEVSDTESERLSDADHSYTNSIVNPRSIIPFSGMFNTHRTEPVRDGRQKVVSRVIDIPMPFTAERKPLSDEAKVELIEQIGEIFPKITPSPNSVTIRDQLLKRLRGIIAQEWPTAELHIYGSAGNGLGLRSADVDMSLCLPKDASSPRRYKGGDEGSARVVLTRLSEIATCNNLEVMGMFLDARVPVIKMRDPASNLHVDVCVNNMLAIRNTQLLKAYADLDERFRYLCMLVKMWAKRRDLNDAYNGTLSSYAYTLLVIHYLQTLDNPVLPCLQRMVNGKVVEDESEIPQVSTGNEGFRMYNTYFDQSVSPETFTSENTDPVHELLVGFFFYYAYVFHYDTDLASIRLGKQTSRSERGWDKDALYEERDGRRESNRVTTENAKTGSGKEVDQKQVRGQGGMTDLETKREQTTYLRPPRIASKHLFCIEDPFDIDHDLSRGMEKAAVTVIRQEMMRAYEMLAGTGDWQSVCEEYG